MKMLGIAKKASENKNSNLYWYRIV